MSRPSLFHFATSELSQDAFLCWLLSWADRSHRIDDAALHEVGVSLVEALFESSGATCPSPPFAVEVDRQVMGIDVMATVGESHVIIIEDKVHSFNHSDQLRRYRVKMEGRHSNREIAFVYLKTGDQSSYADVTQKKWATFTRSQLLKVLRAGAETVRNAIFLDFLAHIEAMEANAKRFETVRPAEWIRWDGAYTGLFGSIQEEFAESGWGYVHNQAGGFFGFWWGWSEIQGGRIYLQLEEESLVAKLWIKERGVRSALRNEWCHRVCEQLPGFERPKKFGFGEYMTVAVHTEDYRVCDGNGLLDLDCTVAKLNKITAEVASLAEYSLV